MISCEGFSFKDENKSVSTRYLFAETKLVKLEATRTQIVWLEIRNFHKELFGRTI